VICYIDDICIYSSKDLKNSSAIHLLLLLFVMYCTIKMGFKLSKGKTFIMPESFKFLGHWFNTLQGTTGIPPMKLNAFLGLRSPLSKAEAVSRIGTIAYFSNYVPLLRLISLPIQHMITAEKGFEWNKIHQLAFDSIKLICSLQFTNATIDPLKPLFISCDSSQICLRLLAYQLDEEGQMNLVYCDSRVLKQIGTKLAALGNFWLWCLQLSKWRLR
jgi:hypothetical protein